VILAKLLEAIAIAVGRTLTSSTFLSGAAAAASSVALDVPPAVAAAVPIAVAFKEAVRRRAEADLERTRAQVADSEEERREYRRERILDGRRRRRRPK